MLKVAFFLGNFILPKYMLKTFTVSNFNQNFNETSDKAGRNEFPWKVIQRNPKDGAFSITKNYKKLSSQKDKSKVFLNESVLDLMMTGGSSNTQ